MNEIEKQDLARALVDILRSDRDVRKAVLNVVLSCPSIVQEY